MLEHNAFSRPNLSPSKTPYGHARQISSKRHSSIRNIWANSLLIATTHVNYFFLPFALPFAGAGALEAVDITLDALEEGAADVALLPPLDFTLSRALFYKRVSKDISRRLLKIVP